MQSISVKVMQNRNTVKLLLIVTYIGLGMGT